MYDKNVFNYGKNINFVIFVIGKYQNNVPT